MDAGAQPSFQIDTFDGICSAENDIDPRYRFFGRIHRHHFHPKGLSHFLGEIQPVGGVGAVAFDHFDIAHCAGGHQLGAGLPAGAENTHRFGVFPRHIFDAQPVGRAHPHPLNDAIGHNCQRFPVFGTEKQDQPDPAVIRRGGNFHPPEISLNHRPGDDIGVEPDGAETLSGSDTVHCLEAIYRFFAVVTCRNQTVRPAPCDRPARVKIAIDIFQRVQHVLNGQQFCDFLVGEDKGHRKTSVIFLFK